MSFIQPVVPTSLIKHLLLLLKYYRVWYQVEALEKEILEKDKEKHLNNCQFFF